jgi:hypothetical protein
MQRLSSFCAGPAATFGQRLPSTFQPFSHEIKPVPDARQGPARTRRFKNVSNLNGFFGRHLILNFQLIRKIGIYSRRRRKIAFL